MKEEGGAARVGILKGGRGRLTRLLAIYCFPVVRISEWDVFIRFLRRRCWWYGMRDGPIVGRRCAERRARIGLSFLPLSPTSQDPNRIRCPTALSLFSFHVAAERPMNKHSP